VFLVPPHQEGLICIIILVLPHRLAHALARFGFRWGRRPGGLAVLVVQRKGVQGVVRVRVGVLGQIRV
jgi:hypothetical protein